MKGSMAEVVSQNRTTDGHYDYEDNGDVSQTYMDEIQQIIRTNPLAGWHWDVDDQTEHEGVIHLHFIHPDIEEFFFSRTLHPKGLYDELELIDGLIAKGPRVEACFTQLLQMIRQKSEQSLANTEAKSRDVLADSCLFPENRDG